MFGKINKFTSQAQNVEDKNNFKKHLDKKNPLKSQIPIVEAEVKTDVEKEPILTSSKKIKKKNLWNGSYKLKNVSCPTQIEEKENIKKRFKIAIDYIDNMNKIHKKTIRFGKHGITEFIDDKDDEKKHKLLTKLGNTHNPLHCNFWRYHILNGESADYKKNWIEIINKI